MTKRLLFEACVAAAVTRLALRLFTVPITVRIVRIAVPGPLARASADACHRAAEVAASRVGHPTCLYRAIVAYALLHRRFERVEFHLGAQTRDGFVAHAWTTIGGRVTDAEAAACESLWSES